MIRGSKFSDITKYTHVGSFDDVDFYMPVDIINGYHLRRYTEVLRHSMFANAGTTADVLRNAMKRILDHCNAGGAVEHRFTDIGGIAKAVLYRTDNPIDEHCAVRMGTMLCFCEYIHNGVIVSENPDMPDVITTNKKIDLALTNPDAYAFFLTLGVNNLEDYKKRSDTLNLKDYFQERKEVLIAMERLT